MKPLIKVKKVFHLTCPDRNQLVTRLKKRALKDNRLDDANETVIRNRLDIYEAREQAGAGLLWAGPRPDH